ncbi:MAG: proteasome accessory factor PafA2 family protein [Gemmatimonadales bacterium]
MTFERPPSPLFGAETEYAVTGWAAPGRRKPLGAAFRGTAVSRLDHLLDGRGQGVFLTNGQRFYLDAGDHPEIASSEVTNPFDLVEQIRQGEAIMAFLAQAIEVAGLASEVAVYRTNVDYGDPAVKAGPTGWGQHENYLVSRHPLEYSAPLLGHLASRLVYCGGGGFNPLSSEGEFSLSPRASFLEAVVSEHSTGKRPLFHIRNEPHNGRGWHRLHLICGETVCGDVPIVLKFGTTALILAAIESGLDPGWGVVLESPLDAIRVFAGDPTCRATARLADGRSISALDLQLQYLAVVDQAARNGTLPPWAPSLIELWSEQLAGLARDPGELATSVDWVMKYRLAERLSDRPARFELDFRFGQLGRDGIYEQLDRQGLCRRMVERPDRPHPVGDPPADTRARRRGEAVAEYRLEPRKMQVFCDWTRVVDCASDRMLDLSDPFSTTATWQRREPRPERRPPVALAAADDLFSEVF